MHLLLWLLSSYAFACTCPKAPPREAAVFFRGKVVAIEAVSVTKSRIRFDVTDGKFSEVLTAANASACGFPFQVGQNYEVFANKTSDSLSVSLCSGTHKLK